MTGGTTGDDPLARPVRDPFAMSTTNPVAFLSEVALAAELVTVVHVHPGSLFNHEKITLIFFMTGKTVKGFLLSTVYKRNIAMGHFLSLRDLDVLIVVALAALETLNFILAGPGPKTLALVPGLYQHGIRR